MNENYLFDDARWEQLEEQVNRHIKPVETIIEEQYQTNNRAIEKKKREGLPSPDATTLKQANAAIYKSAKDLTGKSKLTESLRINRAVGLKALSQYIKIAGISAYSKITAPARAILKHMYKSDINACKKEYDRINKKFSSIKETIDKRARRRLRRINLFNMRKGRATYGEDVLPYTPTEQKKLDRYEKRLNEISLYSNSIQLKLQKIIYQEEKETELIDNAKAQLGIGPAVQTDKEDINKDKKEHGQLENTYTEQSWKPKNDSQQIDSRSAEKERAKNQQKEMKKLENGLDKKVIKTLKSMYLTNGQYHAALVVANKLPEVNIEKRENIKDMDASKIIPLSYICSKYPEQKDMFDALSKLSAKDLLDIGYGVDDRTLDADKIMKLAAKEPFSSEEFDKGETISESQTYERMEGEEPEKVIDITYAADLNSASVTKGAATSISSPVIISNDDEPISDIRDCDPSILYKSFEENLNSAIEKSQIARAEDIYRDFDEGLKSGEYIDFEIEGKAYRVEKDQTGKFKVSEYDFEETNQYKELDKSQAIQKFAQYSKQIHEYVPVKHTDGKETRQKDTEEKIR